MTRPAWQVALLNSKARKAQVALLHSKARKAGMESDEINKKSAVLYIGIPPHGRKLISEMTLSDVRDYGVECSKSKHAPKAAIGLLILHTLKLAEQ